MKKFIFILVFLFLLMGCFKSIDRINSKERIDVCITEDYVVISIADKQITLEKMKRFEKVREAFVEGYNLDPSSEVISGYGGWLNYQYNFLDKK